MLSVAARFAKWDQTGTLILISKGSPLQGIDKAWNILKNVADLGNRKMKMPDTNIIGRTTLTLIRLELVMDTHIWVKHTS